MRGSLSGGIWGLVLGGAAIGVASQVTLPRDAVIAEDPPAQDAAAVAEVNAAPEAAPVAEVPAEEMAADDVPAEEIIVAAPPEAAPVEGAPVEDVIVTAPPEAAPAAEVPAEEVMAEPVPEETPAEVEPAEEIIVAPPPEAAPAEELPAAEVMADPLPEEIPADEVPAEAVIVTPPPEEAPAEETPAEEALVAPATTEPVAEDAREQPVAPQTPAETTDSADPAPAALALVPDAAVAAADLARLAHATPFANPRNLPLVSVLLLADVPFAATPADVAQIGFPVTVLIDPAGGDAAGTMAGFRAERVETGVIADGAGAVPAALDVLDETVLVYADTGSDIPPEVMALLAAQGYGFVTPQSGGAADALAMAAQAQVPAVTVLRDLFDEGDDATAVRRVLSQAVARAQQTGAAVIVGPASTTAVAHLRDWGAGLDGAAFLMAPASAILNVATR